jgi:hypothetical protein
MGRCGMVLLLIWILRRSGRLRELEGAIRVYEEDQRGDPAHLEKMRELKLFYDYLNKTMGPKPGKQCDCQDDHHQLQTALGKVPGPLGKRQ